MNNMTNNDSLKNYKKLFLIRETERRVQADWFDDNMKTPAHLSIGQEGIVVGVLSCLPPHSPLMGTYRSHALYLAATEDVQGFFAEMYGKITGPSRGKGGSMHLASPKHGLISTSAVVATTIPMALGIAMAKKIKNEPGVTVVFFGDGAVEEGVFWESLNFACLKKLKIIFVCEDNGWAIHTPRKERHGFYSFSDAVNGFKCHSRIADGSNTDNIANNTQELMCLMESDGQPGVLHATYFRFNEHVGIKEDMLELYRSNEHCHTEEELYKKFDPVLRYEQQLITEGYIEEVTKIKREVKELIETSVQLAKEAPFPGNHELYENVFDIDNEDLL